MLVIKRLVQAIYVYYLRSKWDSEIAYSRTFCLVLSMVIFNTITLLMVLHDYNIDVTLSFNSNSADAVLLAAFVLLFYYLFRKAFPEKKMFETELSAQQQRWYEWAALFILLGPLCLFFLVERITR